MENENKESLFHYSPENFQIVTTILNIKLEQDSSPLMFTQIYGQYETMSFGDVDPVKTAISVISSLDKVLLPFIAMEPSNKSKSPNCNIKAWSRGTKMLCHEKLESQILGVVSGENTDL